ncbi:MAG: aminopeptidase P family protein [Deltaproteobacteria bacterium]|nr:aminopeptidase P family protein [Deltaproteobacteria bacterium]MBW2073256.1 aminopeptidase P family protein [Deltaproteobacteria bacterium]RLB83311.1 MAG: aminopeptidase P family protein [Deltaproteobacteria bacterium]
MTTHATYPVSYDLVPPTEILSRISRLQQELAQTALNGAIILDGVNMFYYTGTIQDGALFVPTDGVPVFFIRRSFERAKRETPLKVLVQFKRFGELPAKLAGSGYQVARLGLDETTIPVSIFKKLSKALPHTVFEDISLTLSMIRSVKSDYEIGLIREAGKRHRAIYDQIPDMIQEGITEWELGSAIHANMLRLGYTGIGRLATFNSEFFAGVISFGESGNFPTASVGPDGFVGLSPAFPFLGGARRLKKGDIIFADTGFAYEGYFTDKTRIFSLGRPPQAAVDAHNVCLDIQEAVRSRLKPGMIPAQIFKEVYQTEVFSRNFEEHFMGFGSNQVPFLGHGIGLVIDEFPAIAGKIDFPLKENMVIAVEPKKGLKGIGLVGVENTFLVTEQGGEKLTPGSDEITVVL